jgi:hypothetical protein
MHIGVNSVNPDAYGGWSGRLSGCEQDAHTMIRIARAEGFTTRPLLTRDATSENVLDAIADAARELGPGDMFPLTYAGHGGQIAQTGEDTETDQKDETWVLYDRMLIDDELSAAFAAFREDVNVVLLSDSCHSGTLYRLVPRIEETQYAAVKRSFYENLDVGRSPHGLLAAIPHPVPQPSAAVRNRTAEPPRANSSPGRKGNGGTMTALPRPTVHGPGPVVGPGGDGRTPAQVVTRAMPFHVNTEVVQAGAGMYRAIQDSVRSRSPIVANGVAISGCQDNQLSQEVGGAGVFTTTLDRVWADNTFVGSYETLHRTIVAQMGPNQTPELGLFGSRPESLVGRTPFNPGSLGTSKSQVTGVMAHVRRELTCRGSVTVTEVRDGSGDRYGGTAR